MTKIRFKIVFFKNARVFVKFFCVLIGHSFWYIVNFNQKRNIKGNEPFIAQKNRKTSKKKW